MTVKVKKPVATNVIVPPKKKKKPGNKTDYDVRISVYKSSRKRGGKNEENGIVMFADSLFELFITEDTDRIAIKKDAKKLYFVTKKDVKFGDGTSCLTRIENNKGKLQYSREVDLDVLKQFIGEYSLEFDSKKQLYYIDLDHRSDLTNTMSGTFNKEHNYPATKQVIDRGLSKKSDDAIEMAVVDVKPVDPEVKLESDKKKSSGKNASADTDAQKAEIFQLLDVLGSDKTNTYAVALVNLIKEKVTAL